MFERKPMFCEPRHLKAEGYQPDVPVIEPDAEHPANVITSLLPNGRHAITLDIDMPCAVIPSSTPGHYHLLIDKQLSEYEYGQLLFALEMAGVVQHGFRSSFQQRGFTTLRMPWVNRFEQIGEETPGPAEAGSQAETEEPF